MFHRFTLNSEETGELAAVGVVMPSGVVFVEYLERDMFEQRVQDAEAYPDGVSEFIDIIENEPRVVFMWEDDPDAVIDEKVETTPENVYERVPEEL